jgi:perosamine synthetase
MITRLDPSPPAAPERVPLSEPELAGNEWKYVKECLDSTWVSSAGPWIDRFEEMVAERVGVRHAVATSSGTAALHVALLAAGVQPGDEVLCSTLTFIAPANAIRYVGAHPVFVDAEPAYWQMDVSLVERFLETHCEVRDGVAYNRATGRRVSAVTPVHLLGHPCDIDRLRRVAGLYGLTVVEDAAEGLGGHYKGRPIGQTDSLSILSFNGNKIVTTGGGGMVLTDNPEWARRARHLASQAKDDPTEYVHSEIGFNYRLTNLQAALGCAQIEQLEHHVACKRRIASGYDRILEGVPGVSTTPEASWARSTFWLYTLQIDPDRFGMDSRELGRRLLEIGVQTRPLWQPMHRSRPHARSQVLGGEVADRIYRESISLPCSVGLDLEVVERIARQIRDWAAYPRVLGI